MKLYFIQVKTCENKFLVKDGWRPGMFVIDGENAYGRTLDIQVNPVVSGYLSADYAAELVKNVGSQFHATTFEVVEFAPVKRCL